MLYHCFLKCYSLEQVSSWCLLLSQLYYNFLYDTSASFFYSKLDYWTCDTDGLNSSSSITSLSDSNSLFLISDPLFWACIRVIWLFFIRSVHHWLLWLIQVIFLDIVFQKGQTCHNPPCTLITVGFTKESNLILFVFMRVVCRQVLVPYPTQKYPINSTDAYAYTNCIVADMG